MCVAGRITRCDAQAIVGRGNLGDRKLVVQLMKAKVLQHSDLLRSLINDYKARAFQDCKSFKQRFKFWIAAAIEGVRTGAKIALIAVKHLCGAIVPAIVFCP